MSETSPITAQSNLAHDAEGPTVFEWASEYQKQAVEAAPGTPLLLMGGFNSGKTSAAILHAIALAGSFPGYKYAVLRKTFKDLSQTTRPSFDSWIDKNRVVKSSATEVVLDNGSSFVFHHLDSPDSATILKGLEINGALLDQAEQMQERTFTLLYGRLGRWRKAKVPQWILDSYPGEWPWREAGTNRPVPPISCILTANPAEDVDPELHWLWQRFSPESEQWREKWSKKGYRQIIFDSRSNKFAGQQNLDILMDQDEDYVARFVRGEWVKSKGSIFKIDPKSILDYDPELIAKIKNSMVQYRILDHGDSAPTCCLWIAVDGENRAFVWQEYYQPGVDSTGREYNVQDHRRAITAMSQGLNVRNNLADPSIFNKTRNITGFSKKANRWCLAPDTKILTADLRHVRADSLCAGDKIAGFDEGSTDERFRANRSRTTDRRWRCAVVGRAEKVHLPSYRIALSDGTVLLASEDHKWLINPTGQWRIWRKTKDLSVGQRILRATETWDADESYAAGYLAGVFDGEGYLSMWEKDGKTTVRTGFNQLENELLGYAEEQLLARGFKYSKHKQPVSASKSGRPTIGITICTRAQILRLLGTIRPKRLLPKFDFEKLGRVHAIAKPVIVSIEFVGYQDLIALSTSTKTLIAEGLMSHNSVADEYSNSTLIKEATTIYWRDADNNEDLSRSRLRQYLKLDPRVKHPITGETNSPHMYFIKYDPDLFPMGCNHVIQEIRGAKRMQVGENDGKPIYNDERDDTVPDHALDPVRYFVNARALPASPAPLPTVPKAIAHGPQERTRVLITLPPIDTVPRGREDRRDKQWKSRAGGY